MSGQLRTDPLFVGLTRPTMIFGVSLFFALLNIMVTIVLFIQSPGIKILFIAVIVHLIGYLMCFKEPRFIELYLNKASKCNQCSNKRFYGANSYSV